jgi:hypothetical protein
MNLVHLVLLLVAAVLAIGVYVGWREYRRAGEDEAFLRRVLEDAQAKRCAEAERRRGKAS